MAYKDVVLDKALGYWRLGEASGTTAVDEALAGNDGTYKNAPTLGVASLLPGDSDTCITLDGANDYVHVIDSVAGGHSFTGMGAASDAYSIEAWIKTSVAANTSEGNWRPERLIAELRQETSAGTMKCPFSFGIEDDHLALGRTNAYTSGSDRVQGVTAINDGASHHVVATINGNDWKLYVDGVQDASGTFATATGDCSVGSTTANLTLGCRTTDTGGASQYWNGQLDEVALYDVELSADDVEARYVSGQTGGTVDSFTRGNATDKTQCSASSEFSASFPATEAYDGTSGNVTACWISTSGNAPNVDGSCYLEWDFGASNDQEVTAIRMGKRSGSAGTQNFPKDIKLLGSATGAFAGEETDLGTITFADPATGAWADWLKVTTPGSYRYLRVEIHTKYNSGGAQSWVAVVEAEFGVQTIVISGGGLSETLAETINVSDTLLTPMLEVLSNTISLTPTAVVGVARTIVEALTFYDGPGLLEVFHETAAITDSPVLLRRVAEVITQPMTLTDTLAFQHASTLVEQMLVSDTMSSNANTNAYLSEGVSVRTALQVAFHALVSEQADITAAELSVVQKAARVTEALVLTGVVTDIHRAKQVVVEALVLQALAERLFEEAVLDGVTLSEALAALQKHFEQLLDSALFGETLAQSLRLMALVDESLEMTASEALLARLQGTITETLSFAGVLKLPDAEYAAWVVGTEGFAVSEYTNFPFNSFAVLGGKYLGATEAGIYELEGADDAGTEIDAVLKSGLMQFGTSRKKRIPSVYLGYTSDGRLVLKMSVTESGAKKEYWYELTETQGAPETARIKTGRGLKARYWQWELTNAGGAAFELDEVQLEKIVLTRRL